MKTSFLQWRKEKDPRASYSKFFSHKNGFLLPFMRHRKSHPDPSFPGKFPLPLLLPTPPPSTPTLLACVTSVSVGIFLFLLFVCLFVCLPTKHLGAQKLVKTCSFAPDRVGIWKCWFLRRGETGVPGEKPRGARTKTSKLNLHMTPGPGVEPGGAVLRSPQFSRGQKAKNAANPRKA